MERAGFFADPLEIAWMRAQVRSALFGGDPVVRVDRFELRERLGIGAMGSVWLAHDPELSRDVALKILLGGDGGGELLRREAQAMARLRHPNVVAVHEIGTWQGIAFVAMERVEGPTVRAWLAARRRGVDEILAVFAGAGRGLAAAHVAGLVHRDFKPDNVLVDASGLARVADFGLARATDDGAAGPAGTPAYMAPEQLRGEPATPRSDQFAFAVALHEALHGQRPFAGITAADLIAAIEAGEPRARSAGRAAVGALPPAARRALVRALAADPAARHADMDALLRELRPPARPIAWWIAGGLVLALAAMVVWIAARPAPGGAAAIDRCDGADAALAGAWNATRAREVRDAIASGDKPYSATAAARTTEILDDYARRWRVAHRQACEATRGFRIQSTTLTTARQLCLDDRRRVLAALAARFATGGATLGEQAVRAASSLPSLERCGDLAALRQRRPLPDDPAAAARVEALFGELAEAQAAQLAGQYADAVARARAVLASGEPLGHLPLVAQALLLAGTASAALDDAEGERLLERAYHEAIAAGDDSDAALAAAALAQATGFGDERVADGRRWVATADAHLRRVGDDPVVRAKLVNIEANLAQVAGDYAAAQAGFRRAQDAWRALPGDHRVDLGGALHNEGNAFGLLGRYAERVERLEQAVGIWREVLGESHPLLAMGHANLGAALRDVERHDDALVELQRALAIERANLGDDHPDVALTMDGIGATHGAAGAWDLAEQHHRRAEAILVARLGGDHIMVQIVRTNLGLAALNLGRLDDAEAHVRAALAGKQAVRGAAHPSTAVNLLLLGDIAARRRRPADALAHFTRALAVLEAAMPADSPLLGDPLVGIGESELALGNLRAARAAFERAIALWTAAPDTPAADLARARLGLAQVRWASGERGARADVAAAAAVLAAAGPGHADIHARATAWLAAHPE